MECLEGYQQRYLISCGIGRVEKFILHKGSGQEKTKNDCYLGDRCKDLNKLQFTKSDGITPFYDFWMEMVDDDMAVVWIKFSTSTVCIYYDETAADPAAAKNPAAPA